MSDLAARYAVCERVVRQGSFADDVAVIRGAGVVAMGVDEAAVDAIGVDEALRILDGEGVAASSYMGLENILRPDGGTASFDEAARRLDVAAELGAPAAIVATGPLGARPLAEADAICRDWLERAAPIAGERGVRLMLEPVHPVMRFWSYVHTLRHGLDLVEGVVGVGVLLDFGHLWWENDLDALIRVHVDEIVSVQVTNVDSGAMEEVRYDRAPLPAGGDVPVADLVALLESSGYRGWYEDETIVRIPRDQRLDMLRESRKWFEAL
jgi:sugar phosphate isomerase/epimerase